MSESQFLLPDVGEGLTEAEIVSWKVAPGEQVAVNQVLVEIETAKSLVELPSPFDGTVGELLVDGGPDRRGRDARSSRSPRAPRRAQRARAREPEPADEIVADAASTVSHEEEPKPGAVLVGYGSAGHGSSRRRRVSHPGTASIPVAFTGSIAAPRHGRSLRTVARPRLQPRRPRRPHPDEPGRRVPAGRSSRSRRSASSPRTSASTSAW